MSPEHVHSPVHPVPVHREHRDMPGEFGGGAAGPCGSWQRVKPHQASAPLPRSFKESDGVKQAQQVVAAAGGSRVAEDHHGCPVSMLGDDIAGVGGRHEFRVAHQHSFC